MKSNRDDDDDDDDDEEESETSSVWPTQLSQEQNSVIVKAADANHHVKKPPLSYSATKKMPAATKFKKASQAPRRFKSAFIFFSTEKHKQIRAEMGVKGLVEKTTNIAKLVSKAWRDLSHGERALWEAMARKDRVRFELEKSYYKGPWRVPANTRAPKDPTAPKRPMSAFLAFSNKRRGTVKRNNPDMTNAEVSRMLSQMWKQASDRIRQKYIDEELVKRNKYKAAKADWKQKNDEEKREFEQQQEKDALWMVDNSEEQSSSARSSDMDFLHWQQGLEDLKRASFPIDGNRYLVSNQVTTSAGKSLYGDSCAGLNQVRNSFATNHQFTQSQLQSSLARGSEVDLFNLQQGRGDLNRTSFPILGKNYFATNQITPEDSFAGLVQARNSYQFTPTRSSLYGGGIPAYFDPFRTLPVADSGRTFATSLIGQPLQCFGDMRLHTQMAAPINSQQVQNLSAIFGLPPTSDILPVLHRGSSSTRGHIM